MLIFQFLALAARINFPRFFIAAARAARAIELSSGVLDDDLFSDGSGLMCSSSSLTTTSLIFLSVVRTMASAGPVPAPDACVPFPPEGLLTHLSETIDQRSSFVLCPGFIFGSHPLEPSSRSGNKHFLFWYWRLECLARRPRLVFL